MDAADRGCRAAWGPRIAAEQPRSCNSGTDQLDEIGQTAGQMRRLDQEPVNAVIDEPLLHLIADLRTGAVQRALSASAREALIQLPDRQVLVPRPAAARCGNEVVLPFGTTLNTASGNGPSRS